MLSDYWPDGTFLDLKSCDTPVIDITATNNILNDLFEDGIMEPSLFSGIPTDFVDTDMPPLSFGVGGILENLDPYPPSFSNQSDTLIADAFETSPVPAIEEKRTVLPVGSVLLGSDGKKYILTATTTAPANVSQNQEQNSPLLEYLRGTATQFQHSPHDIERSITPEEERPQWGKSQSKGAIVARANREKHKAYVTSLESEVTKLRRSNRELREITTTLQDEVTRLRDDIQALRNSSQLAEILRSVDLSSLMKQQKNVAVAEVENPAPLRLALRKRAMVNDSGDTGVKRARSDTVQPVKGRALRIQVVGRRLALGSSPPPRCV